MRTYLLLLSFISLFYSCSKKSSENIAQKSSEKSLVFFVFLAANNNILTSDITATIDENTKEIRANIPFGISLSSLKATFSASPNATVWVGGVMQGSGVSINNFTNPVIYQVKAEDNSVKEYYVILTTIPQTNVFFDFGFTVNNNPSLSTNINASINYSSNTINIVFPNGISLSNLKANFTTPPNTIVTNFYGVNQISGSTTNNFSLPTIYKVASPDGSSKTFTIKATVATGGTNIYIAGINDDAFFRGMRVWKNGIVINSAETWLADIYDMFVQGDDVYVVGYDESGSGKVAKLWKNGVVTNLSQPNKNTIAKAVFVSGNDVYVVGEEQHPFIFSYHTVKLWKNGAETSLTTGLTAAHVTDICVVNGDVYIVGYDYNTFPHNILWKNGVVNSLSGLNATPLGITNINNDIYIVGGMNDTVKLWKNGVVTNLGSPNVKHEALTITSSGSDIYVTGFEGNSPHQKKYWKNGVEYNVDIPYYLSGFGFAAKGIDIYVLSSEVSQIPPYAISYKIEVWKNGQRLGLNHSGFNTSYAKCIVVQ